MNMSNQFLYIEYIKEYNDWSAAYGAISIFIKSILINFKLN